MFAGKLLSSFLITWFNWLRNDTLSLPVLFSLKKEDKNLFYNVILGKHLPWSVTTRRRKKEKCMTSKSITAYSHLLMFLITVCLMLTSLLAMSGTGLLFTKGGQNKTKQYGNRCHRVSPLVSDHTTAKWLTAYCFKKSNIQSKCNHLNNFYKWINKSLLRFCFTKWNVCSGSTTR